MPFRSRKETLGGGGRLRGGRQHVGLEGVLCVLLALSEVASAFELPASQGELGMSSCWRLKQDEEGPHLLFPDPERGACEPQKYFAQTFSCTAQTSVDFQAQVLAPDDISDSLKLGVDNNDLKDWHVVDDSGYNPVVQTSGVESPWKNAWATSTTSPSFNVEPGIVYELKFFVPVEHVDDIKYNGAGLGFKDVAFVEGRDKCSWAGGAVCAKMKSAPTKLCVDHAELFCDALIGHNGAAESTCSEFCAGSDLVCAEAWEEADDSCTSKANGEIELLTCDTAKKDQMCRCKPTPNPGADHICLLVESAGAIFKNVMQDSGFARFSVDGVVDGGGDVESLGERGPVV